MKLLIISSIAISVSFQGFSQAASPEVIATSGSHLDNGSMQMSYTIGETVITTESNANTIATQGFHQTKLSAVGTEDLQPDILIEVYPNPAQDQLTVSTDQSIGNGQIFLFDAKGAVVYTNKLEEKDHTIDFNAYESGTYYLKVNNGNGPIKTFTIQKIQ